MSTPTWPEVLRLAIQSHIQDLHVALPGEIIDYDAQKQTCTVQPAIARTLFTDDQVKTTEALPTLYEVPVAFPRGGGFFVSFPIEPGDSVLLVFNERNAGNWRRNGSAAPHDDRTHSLSSPVAIPGLFKDSAAIGDGTFNQLALGKDGGKQIHIKADSVNLGSENPTDFVTLANKLVTAFNAHTHSGVTTGGGASGAPMVPLTASQVASSVVKSD